MAEKATRLALGKLGHAAGRSPTRNMTLSSAGYADLAAYRAQVRSRVGDYLDADQADRLVYQYGSGVEDLIRRFEQQPDAARRLCDTRPNLVGEVRHAVESEMAMRLDDVVYRRTGLGTIGDPGGECIARCADIMSELLAWSPGRRAAEIERLGPYRRRGDPT